MSIYNFDTDFTSEQLTPPELRTPKRLAWLRVLLEPIQRKWRDIFANNVSFKRGTEVPTWDVAGSYAAGQQVKVGIRRYESKEFQSGFFPPTYPEYWTLIEEDFVGTDARVKFYAGKMSLEYALNLYLNYSATWFPNIYVSTNANAYPTMFLNNSENQALNWMANNSIYTPYFMAQTSTYTSNTFNFVVWVPLALWNTFGTNTNDRNNTVRNVVDRYNTAGVTYTISTY